MSNNNIFTTLGASNHSEGKREENDFYATEPKAIIELLKYEKFNKDIWECACGQNHIANVLKDSDYNVRCSDLIERIKGIEIKDFLADTNTELWKGDIITNPPYKYAQQFIEKSLDIIPEGNKVAMFLKIQFLEGKKRKLLFQKYPPKVLYVSSSRLNCAKNGDFETYKTNSAIAYGWFIWEKGFKGDTVIKWFN